MEQGIGILRSVLDRGTGHACENPRRGNMTFNRYILFRTIVECIGTIACATQLFQHDTWPGIILMSLISLVWICGEIWVARIFSKTHPRRDELSDEHQDSAIRFTFFFMVILMVVLGFAATILSLARRTIYALPSMLLPTLAVFALAVADARYLWLEHEGGDNDED